jgi:predicted ATPase/class 3 adenylate cyclase/Tfp pilus assembly protein PilF
MPQPDSAYAPPTSEAVTLLFADIEGSTALWERDGARMSRALAAHDALARRAVEARGGTVIKTTGDGMFAVFATAGDALAASIDLQRAIAPPEATAGLALHVRCGLHAGIVERRDDDCFGNPVNRAARIMSAAHGGQVLLSQAVVDALRGSLPEPVRLRDLGSVRLKDLATPEHVYQAVHPELRRDFPALRSLEATPNNLPQQATSFVGRVAELADLRRLLAGSRLLTLTGSGGCGKTRLALQVAADALERFPDGVWLVELAAVAEPALVPQSVAQVLGLKEEPGTPIERALAAHLRDKRLLLVIDNCEHLLDACARLVDTLLKQCPDVRILASSREALGIGGEQAYRVPSLSLPDPRQRHTAVSVVAFEAVQLFVDRALLARADFAVDDRNAGAIASICSRLDGIPLALELAAARVRSLSAEAIDGKLNERFRLLTGGSRTALPRQQTLRSLIDWSYDLLNEPARRLLQRLSVFAGGWTLEAAERVCAGDGLDGDAILDLVISLAEKSLAAADTGDGAPRYRMLETVRQYARERLHEAGDGEPLRRRHRDYFLELAEDANARLSGPEQAAWLRRLEVEHENLRAALEWSAVDDDPAPGFRLCAAMQRFWSTRGHLNEGREWCARCLDRAGAGAPTHERAQALAGAGALAMEQGEYATARALLEAGLSIMRTLGDRRGTASSLASLGGIAREQGDYERARALYEESLAIRRESGDRSGIATSLNSLGLVARELGDYAAAKRLYEESLAIDRELGDRRSIAVSLNNLGLMACDLDEIATARVLLEESLAIRRELGDRRGIASSLNNLGDVAREQGDCATAARLLDESLSIRRELGDQRGIAISLCALGHVAFDLGDHARARTLYEQCHAIQRALGDRWGIASSLTYLGNLALEAADPPAARQCHEESLAIKRALGDRWGIAESLGGLASVALASARPLDAARLWGAAAQLREEIGAPMRAGERSRYDRQVAAARSAAGDDTAFNEAWQSGLAATLEHLVSLPPTHSPRP